MKLNSLLPLLLFSLFASTACFAQQQETPPIPIPEPTFILTRKGQRIHQNLDNLPLKVGVHAAAKDWMPEVQIACLFWNKILGAEIFIFIPVPAPDSYPPKPDLVIVTIDPKLECGHGKRCAAFTQFRSEESTGEMLPTLVRMPIGEINKVAAQLMVIHEFGHVLGLDHDVNSMSLMAPELTNPEQKVDQQDIDALRLMYLANP